MPKNVIWLERVLTIVMCFERFLCVFIRSSWLYCNDVCTEIVFHVVLRFARKSRSCHILRMRNGIPHLFSLGSHFKHLSGADILCWSFSCLKVDTEIAENFVFLGLDIAREILAPYSYEFIFSNWSALRVKRSLMHA